MGWKRNCHSFPVKFHFRHVKQEKWASLDALQELLIISFLPYLLTYLLIK